MFNPASRLLMWAAFVLMMQIARGPLLWGLGLLIMGAALGLCRQRAFRMVRRVRVLLGVLFVLFAFFTPGEACISALGAFGPSWEGLSLALAQGARLLFLVLLVALLLESTPDRALVAGFMEVARPLTGRGRAGEVLAVRVLLALRYVETPPEGGWRALLGEPAESEREVLPLRVDAVHWRGWDGLAVILSLGVVFWSVSQ
ncbi:CbiQ family ECF transporter T component [Zoogloea sp.]|uniref:CbiQ family ECF transporter T component n=1 Tax=Zoogloea sp. TaxID=49181 RepID=UPI00260AA0F3|nr:CbiQ family ECF transporter T component [Zoogloea sp.]MDD3353237.1 CbiQ family ECF transporter T component [Zoogloea sp.]